MLKALRKLNFKDFQISLFQDNVDDFLQQLQKISMLDGILIKNVVLAVGDNQIQHKLGRALLGWMIVRKRSAAVIYDKQDAQTNPSKFLTLHSSIADEIDLWVF